MAKKSKSKMSKEKERDIKDDTAALDYRYRHRRELYDQLPEVDKDMRVEKATTGRTSATRKNYADKSAIYKAVGPHTKTKATKDREAQDKKDDKTAYNLRQKESKGVYSDDYYIESKTVGRTGATKPKRGTVKGIQRAVGPAKKKTTKKTVKNKQSKRR